MHCLPSICAGCWPPSAPRLRNNWTREQQRLALVEARLRQIEEESAPPKYEVVLRKVEGMAVVGARQTVPHVSQMGDYRTATLAAGVWLAERTRRERNRNRGRVDAVSQHRIQRRKLLRWKPQLPSAKATRRLLPKPMSRTSPIKLYELPAEAAMATTIHHDVLNEIPQAIIALFAWIGSNGYHSAGAIRELHLFGREVDMQTDEDYERPLVMEMQIPVARL